MAALTRAVPHQRLWHCVLGFALFLGGSLLLAQEFSETGSAENRRSRIAAYA